MNDEMKQKCKKLYDYLKKFSIYELRNIARELGVHSPTTKKVGELCDCIVDICVNGKRGGPNEIKGKGARPKSSANSEWIEEIWRISFEIRENDPYPEEEIKTRIDLKDSAGAESLGGYSKSVVTGYVKISSEGNELLVYRNGAYASDIKIPENVISLYGLRNGDKIGCFDREIGEGRAEVVQVMNVNMLTPDPRKERKIFEQLTPCYASERIRFGAADGELRAIDVLNPIGKGQRALIAAPVASGKTKLLKRMINSVSENNEISDVIVLLIAARPEDVTEFNNKLPRADVFATTFDMSEKVHCQVAALAFENAKRRVEGGRDVIVFVDGVSDLYCADRPRPFDGGYFERPSNLSDFKKYFALARNCEEGGSLTVISALRIQDDDFKDQRIYRDLRKAANREYRLDAAFYEKQIFPPVDFTKSFASGEDYLLTEKEKTIISHIKEKLNNEGDPRSFYGILAKEEDGDDLLNRISKKY